MDKDLKECHRAVCRRVKQCTEGQYIALMSFVFNFGANSFSSSTLLKLHNAEVYEAAADQFERWIYSTDPKTGKKGPDSRLIPRRREEKKQYLRFGMKKYNDDYSSEELRDLIDEELAGRARWLGLYCHSFRRR